MRVLRLAGAVILVSGCGGSGGGGGTPPPPPVTSVTISPATAQSINVGGTVAFSAQTVPAGRTINWSTTDPSKVSLSATTGASTTATGVAAGASQIRATSGTVQSAPVTVTVTGGGGTNPSTASVAATGTTFNPSTVTIAPGGTVTWTFAETHNVTFGAAQPTGGNIPDTPSGSVSRTFPTAGNFPYTCTLHAGMNGTVNVQ
ncbi:MAG: plastocyanin/azurin family copper-binding protein [Gemmatimonadota bacterium]|nr:plastocyanin/azurin family copper-binding protein [Gemmatimonadota bacterium]